MLHSSQASTARRRLRPAALFACLVALLAFATSAQAAKNLVTGFADPLYQASDEPTRQSAFDKTVAENAGIVRVTIAWAHLVPSEPADATNPDDPAYNWAPIDAAVVGAEADGLDVLFTPFRTPAWAEGPNRPEVSIDTAPEGTWKPDPQAFADFGTALAKRYSGNFVPATGGPALPQVRNYEAWNEQNLWAYVSPQYDGKKKVGVEHYRAMLNAFYDAVKQVDDANRVVLGGLAPYGDPPGGIRTRPLEFLRTLFCLTGNLQPTSCPNPAKFDIFGAHPINLSGGPTRSAIDPDDVSSADLPNAVRVLRAAEKQKTIESAKRHPVWVTEFWWESYPDGGAKAKPGLDKHGIWIEQALYLFWKAGASVAINLQLVDDVFDPEEPGSLQTGVYLSDGTPKPAATAFRFPFVFDRRSKSEVFVWGKAPLKGKLTIEKQQGGGWRKVDTLNVKANQRLHDDARRARQGQVPRDGRRRDESRLVASQIGAAALSLSRPRVSPC